MINSVLLRFRIRDIAAVALIAALTPVTGSAQELVASGLMGAQGSAVGPYGHLYVTEGAAGRISRVNLRTGEVSTFHEGGLPLSVIGIGGVVDVLFINRTAYALVTLVGEFGGGVDGIYRIDGPDKATLVADLGAYSAANPPATAFALHNGVFYALEAYDGGFLVSDGHHNRVLQVSRRGKIDVFRAFDNIVPTGMETLDDAVFMAQAGPVPHLPENGAIVAFWPKLPFVAAIAAGAPLLVDVELGRDRALFGLAQGYWPHADIPENAGLPAAEGAGSLVRVDADGRFEMITEALNQPTSLEIIGNDAYVVSLAGTVVKIADVLGTRSRHKYRRHDHDHDYDYDRGDYHHH
ncbi:MAG: hypothetical protein PVF50_11955 [Gammaproteobacteria bacterium]|jgi:hypothetical protein